MSPSERHDQDLERRLRDAFAAKALQVSDADLDQGREDEVAAALSNQHHPRPATRLFAGIGAAAAAAAIVGITVVGLHNGGRHEVVDGLPPASTTASSSTSPSSTTPSSPSSSAGGLETPLRHPAYQRKGRPTTLPTPDGSSTSSTRSSETTPPSSTSHSAASGPSTAFSESSSPGFSAAAHQPPTISPGLPQAGPLGDQDYTGAVPLKDPSGGTTRMLSMPSGTTWQRTAERGNSLTVRLTNLPTDIEAYWRQTLPGEGWVPNGAGWSYPGTSYTVSPITDKGSFTVTW